MGQYSHVGKEHNHNVWTNLPIIKVLFCRLTYIPIVLQSLYINNENMSLLSPTKSFVFSGMFEERIWRASITTAIIAAGSLVFMQKKFLLFIAGCQTQDIMQMERISEIILVGLKQNC